VIFLFLYRVKELAMLLQFRPESVVVLALAMLLNVSSAWSQNQNPPLQPTQNVATPARSQTDNRQGGTSTDAQLAAWLIVDNQNEMALIQLAQQRSKSDNVKEFAHMMRDDHQQLLSKLQPFAGAIRTDATNGRRGTEANDQQPATEPNRGATAVQGAGRTTGQGLPQNAEQGGPAGNQARPVTTRLNLVSLKRELGVQCLQSAMRELGQKNGTEFDECFVGMQIAMHMEAIDTMKVFRTHASPSLQETLDEGIKAAESHLKHAKTLIKEIVQNQAKEAKEKS
jgi:predicted outer membrane protein